MEKSQKKNHSLVFLCIAYMIPIIFQLALFVYQVSHLVISIWNIFATGMMIGLFIYAIRASAFTNKKNNNISSDTKKTKSAGMANKAKYGKKAIAVFVSIAVVFVSLSVLFFRLYDAKTDGLQVVKATVTDQWGETTVDTSVSDEGVTQSESDYIEVYVEYDFGGTTKTATISATTTDRIYVDELKIYVDANGDFVCDYGRALVWKLEAIVFLSFAIMMILIVIFSLNIEFVAGSIFTCVGLSIMFLVGCPLFENFLFNDIVCFVNVFAGVGLYMLLMGMFTLIFGHDAVYGNINYNSHVTKEESAELEEQMGLKTCEKCGAKVSIYDKYCFSCGKKIKE